MNVPYIAYRVRQSSRSKHTADVNDKEFDIFVKFFIVGFALIFAIILFCFVMNCFATYDVVSAETVTILDKTVDRVPKYDEYFVTFSNGNTYEITSYMYSQLTAGMEIEVCNMVKHTWLGDFNGIKIGEYGEIYP